MTELERQAERARIIARVVRINRMISNHRRSIELTRNHQRARVLTELVEVVKKIRERVRKSERVCRGDLPNLRWKI